MLLDFLNLKNDIKDHSKTPVLINSKHKIYLARVNKVIDCLAKILVQFFKD